MSKSQISIPTGEGLTSADVIHELSERLEGISITNGDGEQVFAVSAVPVSGTNSIEIEMSDDTNFVVEVKPKEG